MSKSNIRILTQYFYPDIANTGQLLTELAIGLVNQGISVNIITAYPSYKKTEALYSEKYRGVVIRRLWSTRFNKNGLIGKISNSITFFLASFIYLIFHPNKSSLLIVSNPPFLPLIGAFLKKYRNIPYIFLVHDVYPDIAVQIGYLSRNGIIVRIFNFLNKIIFKKAEKIIVLSNSMKNIIMRKIFNSINQSDEQKIKIIHNWADGSIIKPLSKASNKFLLQNNLTDKFVVLYSGNLGLFHELEIIIEVARNIKDESFCFVFIGDGGKKKILEQLVNQYKLNNVLFFPYQSQEMLPFSLTSASVSLVTLEENIEGLAMPSKLYTLMAAGNPIIAVCDEISDVNTIIQKARCGFSIRHHDYQGMLDILVKMKNEPELILLMGNNARNYFEKHFTLAKAIDGYSKILQNIV